MRADEQNFLMNAFQKIQEDIRAKLSHEFHIHGESGAIGKKNGQIREFLHNHGNSVQLDDQPGDRYNIHSHPPFGGPLTTSASEPDHYMAAYSYLNYDNKLESYLTNGKDVLQILPNSTELIKLIPDPKFEQHRENSPLPSNHRPPSGPASVLEP